MSCTDFFVFFFKQKTAYEMRISDWSSDVCSSDLKSRHLRSALALLPDLSDLASTKPKAAAAPTAMTGLFRTNSLVSSAMSEKSLSRSEPAALDRKSVV